MLKYILSLLFLFTINLVQSQAYIIKNYDVDIKISQNGYFDIEETIAVFFNEERRGIMRDIPKKISVNGEEISVKLSYVEVEGHEHTMLSEGNNRVIRIGEADTYLTGDQIYNIKYRITGAFIFEEDHTAFQYNVIHNWDAPVMKVQFKIELPTDLDIRYNNYQVITGGNGENERNASIEKNGRTIFGQSKSAMEPYENITVAIKLPVDYIEKPIPPTPIYKKDKIWVLPVACIIWFIGFFRNKSKSDLGIIEDKYFPPDNFSPAEVDAYYDNKVNTEDLISLLPYWADMGYIKMMSSSAGAPENELFFKKLKDLDPSVPEYQVILFNALFADEDMVILTELKNKIYSSTYSASSKLKKHLKSKALYDQEHYNLFHSGKMIWISLALVALAVFSFIMGFILTGMGLVLSAGAVFIIHFLTPKKSKDGIALQFHMLGLKQFLEKGDAQKTESLVRENPNYFEKMLPFAIAFGLDQSWMKKMEEYDIPAPHWYAYNIPGMYHQPNYKDFSQSFNVPEIKSVFTSAPASTGSSSSGGGFSGGGSAGGGFGGGGSSW